MSLETLKSNLAEIGGFDQDRKVCINCKKPPKKGENIFTAAGEREFQISGCCEKCFDEMFGDES